MIDDCYKMWYIAIKRLGLPYAWGEYGTAGNRKGMEEALELMYAGGYAVVPAGDKINLLNLASASSFQAFESKINKQREEIYLAVRGGYLPFLEGSGSGGDAHGDTETSKVATDAGEVTDGFHVAHQIQLQLGRVLMDVNEGPDTDIPELSLGGTNPGEVKQQGENLKLADELLEGKLSVEHVRKVLSAPAPENEQDSLAYLRVKSGDDKPGSIKGAASAVAAIQTSFTKGELSQAAAIANVCATFGLDQATAARLFPPLDPVNRVKSDSPPGGGMPGMGGGDPSAMFSEYDDNRMTDALIAEMVRKAELRGAA